MKIWNSKYALTEGLIEQDGEEVGDDERDDAAHRGGSG